MKPDPELKLLDVFNETYFSAKVEKEQKLPMALVAVRILS